MTEEEEAPTLLITLDEYGDVKFNTNSKTLDIAGGLLMLEITKTKLLGLHMQNVIALRKEKEGSKSILKATPDIIRP